METQTKTMFCQRCRKMTKDNGEIFCNKCNEELKENTQYGMECISN